MSMNVRTLFKSAMHFFSGTVPAEKRIHSDFMYYDGGHWFSNARMQTVAGVMFPPNAPKIKILLNEVDLLRLDACPYIAKLGLSTDPNSALKYCAFLYPQPGVEKIEDLSAWVERRSFPDAGIFTYGYTDRSTLQWVPGTQVCKLNANAPSVR